MVVFGETKASELPMLTWKVTKKDSYTACFFEITSKDGLLARGDLPSIGLPPGISHDRGIIFSGRGPVWLYAYLCHLSHPFAWTAVHDPRMGGAVVVQRHVADAPQVGALVKLPEEN